MENFFLHLLNMSLTAGVLVVVVMLLRVVFHKAPRWIHCLLWALVAVRLLCPFTIESHLSLMPDTPAVSLPAPAPDAPPVADTPVMTPVPDTPAVTPPAVDTPPMTVIPPVADTPSAPDASLSAPTPEESADPWQIALTVAAYAWLAGVVILAAYALFTTLRLRRQVGEAAHLEGNLWQCDHIRSPFILGVFRPRIYLPSDLSGGARHSVVAHEQAHLHRRDHWWKPLGFLLLTVYWFNPLMWVAYIFLCRDIEAACDERVVRNMNAADRKAYSEALLSCSAPRRLVSACPLAFGETSVKSRIKSVLSYKKPTIWIIVAALLVSTVAGVCLLTDRPPKVSDALDACIVSTIRAQYASEYVDVRYPAVAYTVFDMEKNGDTVTVYGMMMYREYTITTDDQLFSWVCVEEPFVLTAKDTDDGYETVECWWPEKRNHDSSIREKFPSRYVKKALNFKDFWDTHGPACEADAKANIADGDKYVFLQPEEADVNVFIAYQQDGKGCFIRSSQENRNRSYIGRYAHHSNGHVIFDLGEIKAAFRIHDGKFIYNEYLSSGIPSDVLPPSDVFCLADNTVFCAVSSLTDKDGNSADRTAPLGITHVIRTGMIDTGFIEYFGSSDVQQFTSRADLLAFLNARHEGDMLFIGVDWQISEFDRFDDTFFADNVLLLTYHGTSSGMIVPDVVGYTYAEDGTVLSVEFVEYCPYGVTDDLGAWLMFSGIKKTDLEGVTELKSHFSKRIPTEAYAAAFTEPTEYPETATEKWREFYGYEAGGRLREILTRLNSGEWVEDSSAINRALNFMGCVWIEGDIYYVTDLFDGIMSTDGKVGWLTAEESVRVSWLFDEKEDPSYTFIGKVKKVDGDRVLMECLESEWLTGDVWVDFSRFSKVRVGETFEITYDYMEVTDPPRVTPINVKSVSTTSTTDTTTSETKPTTAKPTAPAKVTFVEFSHPSTTPYAFEDYSLTQYMSPIQPDAAICEWLRTFASRTGWFKKDTYFGAYDAYFTIGEDENYYYIDRVNQVIHHNRRFLSLTKEELSKLDALIRGCDLVQYSRPALIGSTVDWEAITGTAQEYVKGEDGYILLKVDYQFRDRFGETVKVSTRFMPQPTISAANSAICVVYDGEYIGDPGTLDRKTIYAHDVDILSEDTIVSTGIPLYDDLLRQIQTYFYNRSAPVPDCSPLIFEYNSMLSDVGAKVIDLDKNGQSELVIVPIGSARFYSYDVYTIEDNKLVHLLSRYWDEDTETSVAIHILSNGNACRTMVSHSTITDYYRYKDGVLVFVERVAYDPAYAEKIGWETDEPYFHTTVPNTADTTDGYEPITAEKQDEIYRKYFTVSESTVAIQGIPFSL